MTDQEIIRNRMIEIIESHGYKPVRGDNGHFHKKGKTYEISIYTEPFNKITLYVCPPTGDAIVQLKHINLDYEELSLLIDIFNKNYN